MKDKDYLQLGETYHAIFLEMTRDEAKAALVGASTRADFPDISQDIESSLGQSEFKSVLKSIENEFRGRESELGDNIMNLLRDKLGFDPPSPSPTGDVPEDDLDEDDPRRDGPGYDPDGNKIPDYEDPEDDMSDEELERWNAEENERENGWVDPNFFDGEGGVQTNPIQSHSDQQDLNIPEDWHAKILNLGFKPTGEGAGGYKLEPEPGTYMNITATGSGFIEGKSGILNMSTYTPGGWDSTSEIDLPDAEGNPGFNTRHWQYLLSNAIDQFYQKHNLEMSPEMSQQIEDMRGPNQ
jgi:hypothetical protein